MMRKNWILILGVIVALAGCKDDTAADAGDEQTDRWESNSNTPKIGEVQNIETLFDEDQFANPAHYDLLKELNICDTIPMEGSPCATCIPKFFKFHAFKNDTDIRDAFMLQIKARSILKGQREPLPMRHLIVFERENGTLVKVNGFRGNLIGTRENASGVKDLIIRFYIPEDEAFLNCLFEWKDNKYSFVSVEEIDGGGGNGAVKESLKDSISKIVYQDLMMNAMLF